MNEIVMGPCTFHIETQYRRPDTPRLNLRVLNSTVSQLRYMTDRRLLYFEHNRRTNTASVSDVLAEAEGVNTSDRFCSFVDGWRPAHPSSHDLQVVINNALSVLSSVEHPPDSKVEAARLMLENAGANAQ